MGTSALRRLAQLRSLRPDLEFVDLRGNLDTRIGKVSSGELDAAILASAGITRMGWTEHISAYIPTAQMIPAVGQGAIGIEGRLDDGRTLRLTAPLIHRDTQNCVDMERSIMAALDGGCQTPFAAHARRLDGGVTQIDSMVASVDGRRMARASSTGSDGRAAVQDIIAQLLDQGAEAIMAEARSAS
jgi:hydroxymethylbilane synthase